MSRETEPHDQAGWPKLMGACSAGMIVAAVVVLVARNDYIPAAVLNVFLGLECLRRMFSQSAALRERRPISTPSSLALITSCLVVAIMTIRGALHYGSGNDSWNLMRMLLAIFAAGAGTIAYIAIWLLARLVSWMFPRDPMTRDMLYVAMLILVIPVAWLLLY